MSAGPVPLVPYKVLLVRHVHSWNRIARKEINALFQEGSVSTSGLCKKRGLQYQLKDLPPFLAQRTGFATSAE
jgi:hypothetical protein